MVSAQCNPITFHHKCLSCEAIHRPDKLVEIKTLKNKALIDCLASFKELVPLLSVDTHFHFPVLTVHSRRRLAKVELTL